MCRQKNDATLSKLGDIYQYYIALLECFKMQEGDVIQIEVQGDVTLISNKKSIHQIEVKHHISRKSLADRDSDFWNTLKNWVEYYSRSIVFEKLILFTTANIPENSIFSDWNNRSSKEKYNTLFSVGNITKKRETSFRDSFKFVFDSRLSQDKLEKLFDKITIKSLQPKIQGISSAFALYIITIPDVNKDNYIASLLGMILNKVKEPPHRWEITHEAFQQYAQDNARAFINSQFTPLPLDFESNEPNDNVTKSIQGKIFVKELERINYKTMLPRAISDYWKATQTITRYFSDNISYITDLKAYRNSLNNMMFYEKETVINKETLLTREDEIRHSKTLCSNILGKEARNFGSIVGNQSFFKNGVIHNIVDDEEFTWDVGDANES